MNSGHDLIHETGTYDAYCKDWRALQPIEKNWDNLKRFFSKANRDLRKSQVTSETQVAAIGHQANEVNQDLDQALDLEASALESIANIAVASSEDKQTISTIIATNSSLAQELITLRKELAASKENKIRGQGGNKFSHHC